MRLKLSLPENEDGEPDPLELLALHEWLAEEARTAPGARVTLGGPAPGSPPGGMSGTALDVLDIVLSTAFNAASLTVAIMAWRSSRRGAPPVRIEVEGTGAVVTIADGGEETRARTVAALGEGEPSSAGDR